MANLPRSYPIRILDLGTGSGVLALAFAKIFPSAQVVATDISSDALELAQENAAANKLSDKVSFHLGNWFEALPKNEAAFDLIVSNPPYLSRQEWECTQQEVREHDPKLALVSENEGCDHLLNILTAAKQHLRHGGLLAMETGELHHELLIERAQEAGLSNARGMKDLSKKPRFFLAARPSEVDEKRIIAKVWKRKLSTRKPLRLKLFGFYLRFLFGALYAFGHLGSFFPQKYPIGNDSKAFMKANVQSGSGFHLFRDSFFFNFFATNFT